MCPAPGLTTDLIKEDDLKFNGQSPYLLMVSAGSNDQDSMVNSLRLPRYNE